MIIVAGTVVLKPGTLDALKPHAERMIEASRAEPGCRVYSYGIDVLDPTVIRVYEEWESQGHLDAHFQTDHIKVWRSRLAEIGIESRDIIMWEASSPVAV